MKACCYSSSSPPSTSILAAGPDASLLSRFSALAGGRAPAPRPLRRCGASVVRVMFKLFTEQVVKVVLFTQREARGMGNKDVAPHHLLLGLVAEDRSPAGFLWSGLPWARPWARACSGPAAARAWLRHAAASCGGWARVGCSHRRMRARGQRRRHGAGHRRAPRREMESEKEGKKG
ncbi:unnamed protein product [Urochloa humidicola]